MNRHTRCQALILNTNSTHVLLVQHQKSEKSYWGLPGGELELGETSDQCIRRELREELDIDVDIIETFKLKNVLLNYVFFDNPLLYFNLM